MRTSLERQARKYCLLMLIIIASLAALFTPDHFGHKISRKLIASFYVTERRALNYLIKTVFDRPVALRWIPKSGPKVRLLVEKLCLLKLIRIAHTPNIMV